MNFLEKLDALMEAQHLNKSKLAQISGVPYTTIDGLYKKGYENTKLSTVRKIAAALHVTLDDLVEDNSKYQESPGLSTEAMQVAKDYDVLPVLGKRIVRSVIDDFLEDTTSENIVEPKPTRIIPLFGNSFAAGIGEPDFGNALEDYEIDADVRADFAVRVNGNSMEPYLHDGSIALGVKGTPRDGDVAALMVDGAFYIKQVCIDALGNLYLFSLNRDRKDADLTVWASAGSAVSCFGTIIMKTRVPLPVD